MTTTTTSSRVGELCRLLTEPARGVLPQGTSPAAADRLLAAVLRAPVDQAAALREAAGDEQIVDGYRHRPMLKDASFNNLIGLVRRARYRLLALDREIGALVEQRNTLDRLLKGTDR